MKNLFKIALFFFVSLFANNIYADGPQYQQAMKNALSQMDSAVAPEQYMQLANTFERIAGVEAKEWLPNYYAAYCYALVAFTEHKDKKGIDDLMDKADALINKADALSPNNSEIITVKGLINSGRIMVDPMSRGKKYGTLANLDYMAAEKLDSLNPRPLFLEGQGLFYTPKMFGGGKDRAKPVLTAAVARYKIFKPMTDISPNWGQKMAEDLLKQCE